MPRPRTGGRQGFLLDLGLGNLHHARMGRIVIVGTSGCGKSSLAAEVSRLLDIPWVELDALHWEPGWIEAPPGVFRDRVAAATTGEAWVVAGNYTVVRDLLWPRADTLIWLDYPWPVVFQRVVIRTLRRLLTREVLWNGNRESWRLFFSRDCIVLWMLTTFGRNRRRYTEALADPRWRHLSAHRHRSPRQTARWLVTLSSPVGNGAASPDRT